MDEIANRPSGRLKINILLSSKNVAESGGKSSGVPIVKVVGGSYNTLGNMNLMVDVNMPPNAAKKLILPSISMNFLRDGFESELIVPDLGVGVFIENQTFHCNSISGASLGA